MSAGEQAVVAQAAAESGERLESDEGSAIEEELPEESPTTMWITVGMFGLLVVLSSGCLALQSFF